ncbi:MULTISPECIES: N-acetylglucosamine-6-phosphate deacetylase [unclassified Pseudovibrio]|uniref:N-acetylglucosamine-6-phosphate deacetylase n=1 Tax=unclassified Pseudovibrio TaxID=2627060 RepID=UPI0007AE88B3|nr:MULTISPECIES: N-acetylglucosamine-6-phosphate deacetylase [unclassified Pseudovibrio]KZK94324.1 N-acetylglucosamine-6-phosphate deacetylase [Pseudovibrio sp. W74]KZL09862.1 N-acetylglucosamine-6-phosphate deacetylase [Pseudovibrio sp. Ad14]
MSTAPGNQDIWLCPDQLFDGQNLLSDTAIHLVNGKCVGLSSADQLPADATVKKLSGLITPGFFDIQINGGGGVLYNTSPSPEGLAAIAAAHRQFGTTALLPTVITDAPNVLEDAVEAMKDAYGTHGIKGIHIEGPHISVERKGTHEASWVRPLNERSLQLVRDLRDRDIPVLMTVAPEGVAKGDVARLVEMGAVVSIGHTDAGAAQIKPILEEGANLFTHLFNGMSQMVNREPGAVGTGINSTAYCSLIVDGHHVADDMLRLAIRARPVKDHMIIISDAMPTVGGPENFNLYGHQVYLEDGKLINKAGSLAGAHVTMLESVARMITELQFPAEEVLRMSLSNPAALMGLQQSVASLQNTDLADMLLLAPDYKSFSFLSPML